MEHGALGSLGVYAAKVVGKVPRQEQDCATTHHHRLMDPTVMEQKHRCRCAMKDTVQLMASGPPGPVGVPVPCPVEEVPDREPGTAPILFHSMEEANVKGAMSRVTFAIVTLVQLMVIGVPGAAGERAVGRVMEARCGGTARVTTLDPPTEEELVGGQTPRSSNATLTYVLWMGAGEAGMAGDRVLPLAEEAKRLENGCATIQSHLKVVAPAQETLLRCPDAMCMRAQVGPSEPEEVLLEILMMLNLELLFLTPQ